MHSLLVRSKPLSLGIKQRSADALWNLLQGQLRVRVVDGVAGEKVDDGVRTVSDQDKLLVLLHKISSFRDPLHFVILDVALADMSGSTQMFSVVHTVWLSSWELINIDGEAPVVSDEDRISVCGLQTPEDTCLGVKLESKESQDSLWIQDLHDDTYMPMQIHSETPHAVPVPRKIKGENLGHGRKINRKKFS